ncbi:glycoside hydrolase family 99-like domain-containing protein [Enterocloster aldenensis]|uniref:glycosyltransferase WbsX family protein n=1 Tax=Enterocloster aldenensis TaxID=358742 RepID=UPI0040268902
MKIITMYLPQFYRTKENDEWWGEGYTDWEAVKMARPLFEGHNQPRIPYKNNYYNLLDRNVMQWQAELMRQFSVYGQCFYHYWFKEGKRVLDKPAENLLQWKEIEMPFCFCWANEPWVRSWSAIVDSNVWAPKFESYHGIESGNGVLLGQEYGTEEDWKQHFFYLLEFFKDERYIKIENKPVFMIYKPDHMPRLSDMILFWRKLSLEHGFSGIYLIGANTEKKCGLDAPYIHATGSMFPKTLYKQINDVRTIEYQQVWDYITDVAASEGAGVYVGGILDFDTTARKGKSGVAIIHTDVSVYKKGLMKLLALNEHNGVPFTFLNAWNEWGEGMYLEPDERQGYDYLKATKEAVAFYKDAHWTDTKDNLIEVYKSRADQYKRYWRLMDQWMRKKEHKICLGTILKKMGVGSIAVYGIGILGEHLIRDIEQSDIDIRYGIDARKSKIAHPFPVLSPNQDFPAVDIIVVSVIHEYDDIKEKLSKATSIPIISLEELVLEEEK